MKDKSTFAGLEMVLQGLGFAVTRVPGSHVVYEHSASGAAIVLREHNGDAEVDPASLAVVRRTLVENSLIERDRFEELLRERPKAS